MLHNIIHLLAYDPASPLLFNQGLFMFLFLFFIVVYYQLEYKSTARMAFVVLFSYYFYYKSSGTYFWLLALVTCSDCLLGRGIHACRTAARTRLARWLLTLSLCTDLGLLCYFKYTNFFGSMLARLVGTDFHPLDIFLPIGISFFTFQSLSYTIDIYRGRMKPLTSLLDYAFYVSFFPQLVAGPIVRATDFIPQIHRPVRITQQMFGQGVFLIVAGLFKKAVISDYISINLVDRVFDSPLLYSGFENLLGAYGYTLQIYCDFSGYSDMAIGLALLLGFHFPQNFNVPFLSTSVSDFWRRWHISLSTWIRDYVYIPLGGSRRGKLHTYVNLIITTLLAGLWHGASLNFIVWGGLHGMAQAVHKWWRTDVMRHGKDYRPRGFRRVMACVVTFHFTVLTFIFFRNTELSDSIMMIRRIVTDFHLSSILPVIQGYHTVLYVVLMGYLIHFVPQTWQESIIQRLRLGNVWAGVIAISVMIYIVVQVKSSEVLPFIYFQF